MTNFRSIIAALLFAYICILSYLCLSPVSSEGLMLNHADKLAHTVSYFALAMLCLLLHEEQRLQMRSLTAVFFYGIVIECAQGLTGYRQFSVLDQLSNTIGITMAFAFYRSLKTCKN